MKTLSLSFLLLTGTALAQPEPGPPEFFPPEPMPEPGMVEPGFPGGMFFFVIPDRYRIVPSQVHIEGKATPLVLKIDTMTGQVWQLKITMAQVLRNGRAANEAKYQFVPITTIGGEGGGPAGPGGGFPPGIGGAGEPFIPPPPKAEEITEGTPLRIRIPRDPSAP